MIANALLLAMREIRRNMMRAILTTLGIVIGVGAVITLVTIGNGASASVTKAITAPTPMTMPSVVKIARIMLRRISRKASRSALLIMARARRRIRCGRRGSGYDGAHRRRCPPRASPARS